MYFVSVSITAISLLLIAYQDYSHRAVNWIYFPLLAIGGVLQYFTELHSIRLGLQYPAFNLAFLCLQFVLLKLYFFIRCSNDSNIINKKIGLGDILFLTASCFFFSPLNFIAFYLLSLLFSLGLWLLQPLLVKPGKALVPLAGLQALFLLLTICTCTYLKYSLLNDDWLIIKLTGL